MDAVFRLLDSRERTEREHAARDITLLAFLILSYIWIWQGSFRGAFLVCVVCYFLIGIRSHRRCGEGLVHVGIRLDNAHTAALTAVLLIGPLVAVAFGLGLYLDTWNIARLDRWHEHILGGSVWGCAQQYGLLAIFYRRAHTLFEHHWRASLVAAAIFAVAHLPNPFLSVLTFLAWFVACEVYRRAPNLLVIGIAHSALSFVVASVLPSSVTWGMRVGWGAFRYFD